MLPSSSSTFFFTRHLRGAGEVGRGGVSFFTRDLNPEKNWPGVGIALAMREIFAGMASEKKVATPGSWRNAGGRKIAG